MLEHPVKVNFDLGVIDAKSCSSDVTGGKEGEEMGGSTHALRQNLQSRDTGIGESLRTSQVQSRSSFMLGDEFSTTGGYNSTQGDTRRHSLYSNLSRGSQDVTDAVKPWSAHGKFQDGLKKLRFFVRAYQAIKGSNDDGSKKSKIDLGELAQLLQGAQVDQGFDMVDEEDDDEDEMKIFKTFNPRQYKFNSEYTWPYLGLEPVWKRSEERGVRDIRVIRGLMRALHSYRRLPRHIQEKVARYVRLEKCTRGRTVVRKGQVPENFFFIFAGRLNVSRFEDEESAYEAAQVVSQLNKGDWFGGISMSRNTGREFTVVAMEDCEFLVIDVEDFPHTGLSDVILQEIDQRYQLLRNHPYLRDISDDTLNELVLETRSLDVPHDTVIVKDSKVCRHIYLVCQGSCDVMKWVSVAGVLGGQGDEMSQFPTMEKSVRVKSPEKAIASTPRRKSLSTMKTPRPNTKEGTLVNSCDSLLQKELREIKEGVGKLSIEYLSFPLLNVTKEDQFQYWQKSRAAKKKRESEGECDSTTREKGIFVKLDQIGPGSSFGLPEDLQLMAQMQLISQKSKVIEVPLSSFNRYLRASVAPRARQAFSIFRDLCLSSDDKFSRLNTWQGIKKGLTEDMRLQRETPELNNYDIYFFQGGRAPEIHAPSVRYPGSTSTSNYSTSSSSLRFARKRHSLSNLTLLKLPSVPDAQKRPQTTHTTISASTRAASSRVGLASRRSGTKAL